MWITAGRSGSLGGLNRQIHKAGPGEVTGVSEKGKGVSVQRRKHIPVRNESSVQQIEFMYSHHRGRESRSDGAPLKNFLKASDDI